MWAASKGRERGSDEVGTVLFPLSPELEVECSDESELNMDGE